MACSKTLLYLLLVLASLNIILAQGSGNGPPQRPPNSNGHGPRRPPHSQEDDGPPRPPNSQEDNGPRGPPNSQEDGPRVPPNSQEDDGPPRSPDSQEDGSSRRRPNSNGNRPPRPNSDGGNRPPGPPNSNEDESAESRASFGFGSFQSPLFSFLFPSASGINLPFLSGGSGSNGSQIPFFGNMPNISSLFGQRQEQADGGNNDAEEHEEDAAQSRFFFSLLFPSNTYATTCNYTTQAGRSCLSCTQTLTCFPTNAGTVRTCGRLLPYCYEGRCSKIRGSACFATTTTTTTTTTTVAP